MRKLFLALITLVVVAFMGGCAARTSGGVHFFLQRGVILQITHTCTDRAQVHQAGPGLIREVLGATPVSVGLQPAMWGDRRIHVTVQSIDDAGRVVGSYTQVFAVDSRSTTAETWTISDNRSGGGGGRYSRCSR